MRSVFLRIAGVYTDYGRQPTIVQQIKRIYEKDFQSHFFPGDTETGQAAIHLDDAVDAILATVENRAKIEAKTAILIGEPDPPSYQTLGTKWRGLCGNSSVNNDFQFNGRRKHVKRRNHREVP